VADETRTQVVSATGSELLGASADKDQTRSWRRCDSAEFDEAADLMRATARGRPVAELTT
jgi:hypothetical protein